jgi:ubiquitin-conjugating enzyme E2 A
MNSAQRRLLRDLKTLETDAPYGCAAAPEPNNILHWIATISGPKGTPWEKGRFKLSLTFPSDYPQLPPQARFLSRMFHPNINDHGGVCVDILGRNWTPVNDVGTILLSLQALLCTPNPESPANGDAAGLWKTNRPEYNRRVTEVAAASLRGD